MRIAVVGIPGGWSSEALADAVGKATGERLLVGLDAARLDLAAGSLFCGGPGQTPVDLCTLDAVLIKKAAPQYSPDMLDRLELLRFMAGRGVPCFSDPSLILRLVDRLACTVTLSLAGLPLPPTTVTEDPDEALDAVLGYGHAVLKPLFTSKARGMVLLDAASLGRAGVAAELARFHAANWVMYIQQALDLRGQDLGVCFLGGEYLGTYARRKNVSPDPGGLGWSTSTASGGRYAAFDPPLEIIELAQRAQAPFGLDFTCVDVALTDNGPYIFEVSAFGGFRGLKQACGIDVAELFTAHVLRRLSQMGQEPRA
ncbi:MAG: ATP-grasp family protein [Deltaproteobacteria bacterium HGW-Deltaproteobacteria-8]|jgi:ribosomal protein S6--L-glutamate ligase|nr:MAG: ATP-grasp family protein [Deltaproteobacteria bacterium HGW-Deltaproteobacteria-8]